MAEKIALPVVGQKRSGLGRREILQSLMAGAGAGWALPALGQDHPLHEHLGDPARVAEADAKAGAFGSRPAFLDPHALETLASLAEAIVPGSTQANVAPFVDQLLAVDNEKSQRGFLSAIGAFEGQSLSRYGKPWKDLSAAQQTELLTEASAGPRQLPENRRRPGLAEPAPKATATLKDHFELLKGWIAGAYFSSEIGMRELGWDGNLMFSSFPGCDHPGGHQ